MWRLNNMLLKNECFKEEIKIYLKANENGITIYQEIWNAAKAVLRRKFIMINACLKKQEKN